MFATLFLVRAAAVTMLAVALAWSAYVAWRTRSAVARLAVELGEAPAPGSLRTALAASLGDADVEVAYPLGTSVRFVDGAGNVVSRPVAGPGRVVTPIVRDGRPIALVVHSLAPVAEEELAREIGAAARLAVENERLQAEVLAQLHDLRLSRARIVETGDAARRRLERDLHDGAQQRLLALTYDLRVAGSAARADGESELATLLDGAVDEAHAALEELRELAHGIYPAILTEAGLRPALLGLVDHASIPVELTEFAAERHPPTVETAAYVFADDAVADAVRRAATHALLRVRDTGANLMVEIEDDGTEADSVPVHLADRVGALGGRVERADHVLLAEIPCA
jgi:signal transduction histidine kinase